jgi:hypothetical protein
VASSFGLILSNQPISYFKIASKYFLLYYIDYLSPVIIQVANMIHEHANEIRPTIKNQTDYFPAFSTTALGVEFGANESVISPKIKANIGIEIPFAAAAIEPISSQN